MIVLIVIDLVKLFLTLKGIDIGTQITVSLGNFLWLILPLAAIFIVKNNLKKIINLGGNRKGFFFGSIGTYVILASVVTLANSLFLYFSDGLMVSSGTYVGVLNLATLFGWSTNGFLIGAIQQFTFLLLLATMAHTLMMLKGSWYGVIIKICCMSILVIVISIGPLRAMLIYFINTILFNPEWLSQIAICLSLSCAIYALSYPALNRIKL